MITAEKELFTINKPKRIDYKVEGKPAHIHQVVISDIDMNQHVNSMKYLQWALDTMSLDDIMTKKVKRLDINFLREALYGQKIEIYTQETDNTRQYELRNEEGLICCKLQLTLDNGDKEDR